MEMTRRLTICCDNINKASDKNFIFMTYDLMLEMLLDHDDTVSNIKFDKTNNSFFLMFTLKVSKKGDLIRILMQDYLSTILETEDKVNITLDDVEEGEKGVRYHIFAYKNK